MISSFESTDKLIAALDAAFMVLLQKLMGVQDDIQYRSITGTGGFNDPKLTGETKIAVDRAKALIDGILIVDNLVSKRLEEVKTKRASIKTGFFSLGGAAKELEDQLRLHNLAVSDGIADHLPVELRQLLFTEKDKITSVELALQVGSDQLKVGAKSIIEVDECMSALKAQIADTEAKLALVLPVVTKIGGSAGLAHRSAVANLACAKAAFEFDPLGVRKTFEQNVDLHIAAINSALDGVQKAKEKAYAEFGDAKVLMQRLEDRQPSPARTPELRDWLTKLSTRLDQEDWASASQGLDDWIKEASAVLSIKVPQSSSANQPPNGHPTPPAHPPLPTHVQQVPHIQPVPTSADYHKYAPQEKSRLEKLLDGDLATSTSPEQAAAKAVDPAVEKLLAPQGPAVKPASQTPDNDALDTLLNSKSRTNTAKTTPGSSAANPNAALEDLLAGRPSGPGAAPASAATEVSTKQDSSKLAELFDETKNKKDLPPTPVTARQAAQQPTQAEQDAAARKALEDLLKG